MIRPWEKFSVIEHQVEITSVRVVHRSWGAVVVCVETAQKYPEVTGCTGSEILIGASEQTLLGTYDPGAPSTSVFYPRNMRGWCVCSEYLGRYELNFTLYTPAGFLRAREAGVWRDENWRLARFLNTTNS